MARPLPQQKEALPLPLAALPKEREASDRTSTPMTLTGGQSICWASPAVRSQRGGDPASFHAQTAPKCWSRIDLAQRRARRAIIRGGSARPGLKGRRRWTRAPCHLLPISQKTHTRAVLSKPTQTPIPSPSPAKLIQARPS